MFEAHVLHLLKRYLGEYVHGLSVEALRISVWKGDVVLKDLKLKTEALSSLKLPVNVKAGFIGSITLKVPWKSLGKEPVIVLIDRVFILSHPAPDARSLKDEDKNKLFEAKLQQIEEAESATLDALSRSQSGSDSTNSWLGSLISTIIGNLKISITNVHVRYEDSISHMGHPFCSGITLAKLAAVTTDERGNETFDTSGALDKLSKSVELERLALYHDSNREPWNVDKKWEDLTPSEWIEIFEDGINDQSPVSKWAKKRNYVVFPINGVLKYHRLGKQERNDPNIPIEKASLVLSDVTLKISEIQYHDWIKLLEIFSRYRTYIEFSHIRPAVPIAENPKLWWRYGAQAAVQQKKLCYKLSWEQIQYLCQLRRRYVQLYSTSLQRSASASDGLLELREMEKQLDPKVILLWRLLAHAKVETLKTKEALEKKNTKNKSWFSLNWYGDNENSSDESFLDLPQVSDEGFSREEWRAINNLLSVQSEDDSSLLYGQDNHNIIQYLISVSIEKVAARIVDYGDTEIVYGTFEQLTASTRIKSRSTQCDLLLKYYGLSAPEGSLAQSVSSERKVNALCACFVYSPLGENVDWKLSATISPSHVTVLMESFDRIFDFMKRSNAVSPTVALETANVLQTKIEKVTRRAQEQLQLVMEEQSRFALDIDFDAPKVCVPMMLGPAKDDMSFVLDFGHFKLHTMNDHDHGQNQSIYTKFQITGRDIAAFFTHCNSDAMNKSSNGTTNTETSGKFSSLIDRCGVTVVIDQIKVSHPNYPPSRISIQVPNLGVHFSPMRYRGLMELMNILYATMENYNQSSTDNVYSTVMPWNGTDISSDARMLVWKGIGHSVATWQSCFIVLTGSYLYAMEGQHSSTYQRYLSMSGKQVVEVPSISIGGSQNCLAVSCRGMDIQQALESSSTWVLELQDEEEKDIWLRSLVQSTYLTSAPASIDVLGESRVVSDEIDVPQSSKRKVDRIINGTVVETKVFVYAKNEDEVVESSDESMIIEIMGGGGKVHVVQSDGDLIVKMKMHSFNVKDSLQCCQYNTPRYLAYSVSKDNKSFFPENFDKQSCPIIQDEDDDFTDALPDFLTFQDSSVLSSELGNSFGLQFPESLHDIQENIIGNTNCGEIFYEAYDVDATDFVSINFSTRSSSSPDYDGVDTQMSVCMSKLEFFCNRPTIVALIGFGLDLGQMETTREKTNDLNPPIKVKNDKIGRVKGLLGFGKSRVVFLLAMNVDSVSVILNKEDGSQLATLVQENFLLDLKVHPSSVSIEGTLGNFKLCDMSLGENNNWSWLCDIRNPGVESLIKFKFCSYSPEDDDYGGYDYCLSGRLSAVRIVFLYKFVQEITEYFMGLASPHSEEAIKLVDKVGGFEWLIHKYEIDGATAVKLDLSLDTPIIIIPKSSRSKDFIQLDLGRLNVKNDFIWYGQPENNPSAIHMDILNAAIIGINMAVGVDGCLGKPMIRDGQGLDICVRRSLRDIFRKVPSFSVELKIGYLHGVMSDREYNVILDCTHMNINEEPTLPPSFRGSKSGSDNSMRSLVDKVNLNSQTLLSQTVTVMQVDVNNALLELCNGAHESPLASLSIRGLWVSYRMTSLSETDLYVSIPSFSISDIRPDTKSEMRLLLGSLADVPKSASSELLGNYLEKSSLDPSTKGGQDTVETNLTMLLMDYRWRASSQSCVFRLQQPRILVVPDFLIAVGGFFVPAIKSITGREDSMDPKIDPINGSNFLVLSDPVYKQEENIVHLSPSRQLIADACEIDEYVYDGCGKTISLSVEHKLKNHNRPIIYIGRGKKLRFLNVKIENSALLKNFVYLGNDSSYSISEDDGVHISLSESSLIDTDDIIIDHTHLCRNDGSGCDNNFNLIQSFTFDVQIVSPEFTFYDSTKSTLDDSFYGEKLLRAKLDLNFMYASKDNDTWIRVLAKDLNLEAGSGLIILNPMDISGAYTSVKEKSNMSLVSTDICIHLSFGVISLLLNLQNQAMAALEFGNGIPLVPCTNFYRLWVSSKENSDGFNLTFWRPQPPSSYVVLGDCVTSRSTPPSQAVMAVKNVYGRVRKPIGFTFVGVLLCVRGISIDSGECVCSIWMPIPAPGYVALGCVVNIGNQPPPIHIVYCLRRDLVASTRSSECMFMSTGSKLYPSGFSIWRLDNTISSFCAHSSSQYPPSNICYDLNQSLLWSNTRHHSSNELSAHNSTEFENVSQQTIDKRSSGWDVIRSVSRVSDYFMSTPNFERIWWDKGSDIRSPVSIWRPVSRPGYSIVGDCITESLDPPTLGVLIKNSDQESCAKPVQFTKVAQILGKPNEELYFWYPIAIPGYVSMGCVVTRVDKPPPLHSCYCPRIDLVSQANIADVPVAKSNSKASQSWSVWKIDNQACTFLAHSDLRKPVSTLAFAIGDCSKPKSRQNITSDLKLRFCSITVSDSLCGKMTPLFDITVTNIKLATHGNVKAMNAVLVSSVVASSFNTRIEAWEPLVEPFDGIFKFETYVTDAQPTSRFAKRVSLAATSIVNVNVSAANLEAFVGAALSWKKQLELDEKASKRMGYGISTLRHDVPMNSALDEDDFQSVFIENHLGCDLQLKRVVDSPGKVTIINDGDSSSCWVPPPKFFHRLKETNDGRDARYYVAVRILEAKDLPIVEDDSNLNLFCALRLVVDCQKADQERLFPQSARTKCVKHTDVKENEFTNAKWNELFIVEIPRKTPAKLEFEVMNLAANAGKGEVVGSVSLPIGCDTASLKKVMSTRMINNPSTHENFVNLPLIKRHGNDMEESGGFLVISTVFFDRHVAADIDRETEYSESYSNDVGFCIRLDAKDAWLEIRSLLPVSVIPLTIQNEFIAMEVMLKDGKKHVIYRGLANVKNDLDVKLEVCVCDISYNEDIGKATPRRIAIDEIFENQRNHPIFGWGNKWQNLKGNDPVRWSTRDFSISSKDFFEPPLGPGWQWTSSWIIDKSESVDSDGWAYGYDFSSVKWPPARSRGKSGPDMVRRRRWIRQRQEVNMSKYDSSNLLILNPGSSVTLPWKSIVKSSNHILLVRPFTDDNHSYPWGQEVMIGKPQPFSDHDLVVRQNTNRGSKTHETFKLNQLEKKDALLCCNSSDTSKFWLSLSADASILHTELNDPVYDWKLSVNSPLKLENQLPCPMEFTIWEKNKEESCVERQNGVVSPRNCAYACMADINKPIYVTLLLQGGWVLEKDHVLVLDLSSSEHVSSFIILNQQSKRKVRVSIERDMGGTISAQKIIRFFVPYWIVNDSSLPLTYRLMEIENSDVVEADPLVFSRAKSAKATPNVPTMERKRFSVKRNDRIIDVIEDGSPLPTMLSLHEGAARSGPLSFTSHKESYINPRIGISVAMRDSKAYSPGIPLLELEKKERVEVKAFSADGCYYMLSVLLKTLERTKVVHFQPQAMFINRVGLSICMRQCDFDKETWIHPSDPYTLFSWHSTSSVESLTVMIDGYGWSSPFSISKEGRMRISLKAISGPNDIQLRVHVRSGTKTSRFEVIFSPDCSSSPYRIENRSMLSSIYYRQADGTNDAWKFLAPNAAVSFLWEDLGRRKLLELSIDEANKSKSFQYDVDEVCDHNPIQVSADPAKFVRVTILKDDKTNAVQIKDWMHENVSNVSLVRKGVNVMHDLERNDEKKMLLTEDSEFHFIVELSEFGLSVIDQSPEEILYLSLQNFLLAYSSGLGSGFSRIKLRMHGIQIDNQLPLTPMPVLFRPQKVGEESDAIIKLSVTLQSNSPIDSRVFPYIGFTGPDDSAFVINVHEPIIWRLHEMLNQINISSLYNTDSAAVSVDPIIQIGVVNISEIRFKVSMTMSPGQRPKGVLGFWSSLMTALGNTENMPVKINPKYNKSICMRQSAMISRAISNVMKDILGQPLQLLSGVDILGNAVSALGHMSKGVAALSMDKKFIQSRQRQESKGVEDIGDVIREGGGALAKGLFRGVTGILTKPLEGAKSSGVEGFVQGVGKGIIGAAAQPVSGVLDLLSKTTEGANAMRMKIISAITSEEQLLRRRLPRVISGDSLLRPYDEYKSQGQVILQLAESGSFLGQVDLFKVRGKFALSDAYEDHFMLPKGKIVVVTHRRVMLLQQPLNIISQRKFSPVRDPCSVMWDVLWDDLVTMEMQQRKKDTASAPPSVLLFYTKESTRIIKCSRDTDQALRIYSSVQKALASFGSSTSKDSLRNRVAKPYSPAIDFSSSTLDLLEKGNVSATLPSSFGTPLSSKHHLM